MHMLARLCFGVVRSGQPYRADWLVKTWHSRRYLRICGQAQVPDPSQLHHVV